MDLLASCLRMPETFDDMLMGGHRNSLVRTQEVVDGVLADRCRLDELFVSLANADDLVRMRAGDALEKVCRARPEWLREYVERLLGDVSDIRQPSVQWHVAQMLAHLRGGLDEGQTTRAVELLQRNLTDSTDWIVRNVTMEVLASWAADDPALASWLRPRLQLLQGDARKSVAKRASKFLAALAT